MKNHYQSKSRYLCTFRLMALIFSFGLLSYSASAQLSTLYFSSSVQSYSSNVITGGTVVNCSSSDDDYGYNGSVGFTFVYSGNSYTTFNVTSNGYLGFGGSVPGGSNCSTPTSASTSPTGYTNLISAFGMDLQGPGLTNTEMRVQTLGSAPSRVCVIQWRDWSHYGTTTTERYNFQIRLYETSNNIQIIYGPMTIANAYSPNVGMWGTVNTNFRSLTGTNWVSPAAASTYSSTMSLGTSSYPDSGRTYTWANLPMVIDSVTTIQVGGGVPLGVSQQPIIGVVYYTHGNASPKIVSQMIFNTTGTTNTSDILAAKVMFTKNATPYSSGAVYNQFGSTTTSPSGTFVVNGVDTLVSGANYFWLTYDITTSTSALGDTLDAQCTYVTDDSVSMRVPNVTNPAGYRLIVGPMSGIYTIDPAGTGGRNFISFQDAFNGLAGTGLSGPVTFMVAAGTYTQTTPLIFPCGTVGASSINTITFDGGNGNASSRIITGSIASQALVYICGNYITLRNLTVSNTYTSACAAIGILSGSVGATINNCNVSIAVNNTTSNVIIGAANTSSYYYGTVGVTADSVTIDSNIITGSYYGSIGFYGTSSASQNRNFKIRYNTMTGQGYYGCYLQYIYNNIDFIGNTINVNAGAYMGMYFYYCTNSSSLPTNFTGNKIMNWYGYGVYCYYPGGSTAANTARIFNNMIIGTNNSSYPYDYYGIYLYNTNGNTQIFNNSILIPWSYSSTSYCGIYSSGSSYTAIKNNIIVNTAVSGSAINLYCGTTIPNDSVNFNVYYNNSNATLVYNNATYATAATALVPNIGGDSSVVAMPTFANNTNDLHLVNGGCNVPYGQDYTLAFNPTDFDGQTRNTPSRRGCDEPAPGPSNDLTIDALLSPVAPVASGAQTVTIRIRNVGSTVVTAGTVGFKLNGGTPVTQTWSGSLNTCDTMTIVFATPAVLLTSNTLKVFTGLATDPNRLNDTITTVINAAMSGGTYTINPALPASATNFQRFGSADTALMNGIMGPIVFNVAPGTYNEQVVIPRANGMSYTNTVTYDGGTNGAATHTISIMANSMATVVFNTCNYVTFKNFTITNTFPGSSQAVQIVCSGSNGSNITIKNNIISCPLSGTNTAYAIAAGTGFYGGSSGIGIDSLVIDSNIIYTPYYGLYLYGNTTIQATQPAFTRGFKLRYNTFQCNTLNPYTIYMTYMIYIQSGMDIIGNKFDASTDGYTNPYLYFYYNINHGGTSSTRIIGNYMNGFYYMYFPYYGSSGPQNPTQINNNMVVNTKPTFYWYVYTYPGYQNNIYFYNNSVDGRNSTSGYGLYYYNSSGSGINMFKNNIFMGNASGFYPAYFSSNPSGNAVNYNTYYNGNPSVNTTFPLIYRGGAYTNSTALSTLLTSTVAGDTSYRLLPNSVVSSSNLRLTNGCAVPKGWKDTTSVTINTAPVTTDIDGNARPSAGPPMIGCHEAGALANDLALDSMTSPLPPMVISATGYVTLRIKNVGNTSITSAYLNYIYNGASPVTQVWTGTLNPCDTASLTFSTPVTIGALNSFKVYCASPNSTTDPNRINDTANYTYFTPMSGSFTINASTPSSGTTFNNFNDAINAMKSAGLAGPVLFNVMAGTYNEQVIIPGPTFIAGQNFFNTITFDGGNGNAATRIINFTGASNTSLIFDNCKYVTVRNITINNLAAGVCSGVQFKGSGAGNNVGNTLNNCIVNLPNTGTNGAPCIATGTANYGPALNQCDSIRIDSNSINGGYYGMYLYGNSTTAATWGYNRDYKIRYNTIQNVYYYGMYIYYIQSGIDLIGNTITNMNSGAGYYGLYFYYCVNHNATNAPHRLVGNKLSTMAYNYIYYTSSTPSNPTLIANNVVFNMKNYSTNYGLYIYNSTGYNGEFNVYNNTVCVGGTSTAYGIYYYNSSGGTYSNFKNNIFKVVAGATPNGYPVYFSTNPPTGSVNFNIYQNTAGITGSNYLGYRNGTWNPSSTWNVNTALGDTSWAMNPTFIDSVTNMHLPSACVGRRAANGFSGDTTFTHLYTDMDEQSRPLTPMVGADEYPVAANDMSIIKLYSPGFPVSMGSNSVIAKYANLGNTTISSFTSGYKLNGSAVVTQVNTPTTALSPCDTALITFTTSVTIASPVNTLKVYSASPNTSADGNTLNDTLVAVVSTPLNGVYTINPAAAPSTTNYQTFGTAISDLIGRGVGGNCKFNVSPGTYNERLIIPAFSGSSASNPVTFTSSTGNRGDVTLNGDGSSNYIITSNGMSYTNFKNMTINQPLYTGAGIILYNGAASYDTISNCNVTMQFYTTIANYILNGSGAPLTGMCYRNNLFQGGYYGAYLYSTPNWSTNITMDSNTFQYTAYNTFYFYNHTNLKFKNNQVNMSTGTYTYNYCYMYYCDSATDVAYNNFVTPNANTYAYFYAPYLYCTGNASSHVKFHSNRIDATGNNSYIYNYYPGYYNVYLDYYNNYINTGNSNGYTYNLGYGASNARYYNNTFFSNSGSYTVYYYNSGVANVEIKNNAFYNSGTGYSFYYLGAPIATEFADYNNFYSAGTTNTIYGGGVFTIGAWKSLSSNLAVQRDRNSLSYAPGFNSYVYPYDLNPNLNDSSVWSLNGRGMPQSWITDDLYGNSRSSSVATGPSDIGAIEFTPNANTIPPLATVVGTAASGSTQSFLFGGDTLAQIRWASTSSGVPTGVGMRTWQGKNPPNIGTAAGTTLYTKAYWNLTTYPAGAYDYTPIIYYKDNWMGTVPDKTNMKLIAKYPTTSWVSGLYNGGSVPSTFQDTVNDFMAPAAAITAANISNAYFAGTTASNPVPVQMYKLNAVRSGNNGLVSWNTASEINSDRFIVERSLDGTTFNEAGTVSAAGNSSKMLAYSFNDQNVITNNPTANVIFYRLKMVDRDGSFAYSGIVSFIINVALNNGVVVYPNPFTHELNITVSSVNVTIAKLEVVDIQGRVIAVKSVSVSKGENNISITELSNISSGIYFVNLNLNGETIHAKVIKN